MSDISFEGEHVDTLIAQLPSTKLEDLVESYPLGTLMTLKIVVRVKAVRMDEDRKGKLVRTHMLGVEDVSMTEALTPRQRARLEAGVPDAQPYPGQMTVEDVLAEQAREQSDAF